jgi:hypothetical protein
VAGNILPRVAELTSETRPYHERLLVENPAQSRLEPVIDGRSGHD